MRLDKLTLGSAKDSRTHQFKNLKNVTIDFDQATCWGVDRGVSP